MNNTIVRGLTKVSAAGATIFAIGWGILVLQPEPEAPVAEAQADIFGFEFGGETQQQKFINSLMQEGMEEPRAYDHNGNKMFFSTAVTKESPRQVLERFQRSFVENGLNDRVHMSPPSPPGPDFPTVEQLNSDKNAWKGTESFWAERQQWVDDYLGGMVPRAVTPDGIIMAGTDTKNDGENYVHWAKEVLDMVQDSKKSGKTLSLSDSVKSMRYMDAFREGPDRTRITAVWSDENYDPKKIANIGEDINVSADAPICPGCRRLMQFDGDTEKEYANTAIDGAGQSQDQVMDFYKRALPNRGWELSETAQILEAAERLAIKPPSADGPRILQFTRGGEFMTVTSWNSDHGTSVHLSKSN